VANIGEYFGQHLATPDRVLYRHFDGEQWRDVGVREVAVLVGRWQAALGTLGLQPGERIAVSLKNGVQWVALDLAAAWGSSSCRCTSTTIPTTSPGA